jgi:hypothetical protein
MRQRKLRMQFSPSCGLVLFADNLSDDSVRSSGGSLDQVRAWLQLRVNVCTLALYTPAGWCAVDRNQEPMP